MRSSLFARINSVRAIAILFILVSFATLAFAQEATIVGTVTDPSGAAVPNVAITITNTDTSQVYRFTSNDVGQYVAPGLRIGHYVVRVEATGFKKMEQKDVVLAVGDRARLDFKLEIGNPEQQVTVEANAIAVQSDSSEISGVITGKQVTQLATNGRSIYTLVNLQPGASSLQGDFQTPTPVGGDANVSFNGNRPGHNIYLMDGGENLDRGGAGTFSVMPSIDAIAEFRVLSSNYSAEYGLSSAGTMVTVLKSGTNKYHATAWEFVRNDAFDANSFFNNRNGNDKAKLRYNTYGFNVGGPVDFWKSNHKTFFFYNMEWRKLINGGSFFPKVPPTSAYPTASGSVIPNVITSNYNDPLNASAGGIYVPLSTVVAPEVLFANCPGGVAPSGIVQGNSAATAQRFPNDTIPACMISPNASALLGAGIFPANNALQNGIPAFSGGGDSPTNVREEIVRMDHQFSDKFTIFGHWVSEQIVQTFGTTMWSGDNVPTIGNTFGNPSYSAVIHTIHTISPTLINETAFNYNGNRIAILPKGVITAPAGFTFNRVFPGPNDLDRIPIINLGQQLGTQYSANWTPWNNKADDYQIRDDVSWTRGAHQFKLGASWALYKKIQDIFASTQGNFAFDGHFTQAGQVYTDKNGKEQPAAGSDFADFLLGLSNQYQENGLKDSGHWNNVSWAAYIQDNWRVNNKLTLNLGLRWDGAPHTYEANHRTTNFYPSLYQSDPNALLPNGQVDPTNQFLGESPNPILAGVKFYLNGLGYDGLNGVPKGLVDGGWMNFGPRVGFAFDPWASGKTVIRGGFGVMYERIQGNDMYNMGTNAPFSAGITFNNVQLANPGIGVNLTPQTITIPIVGLTGIDKNYPLPVSYQFSIGVQQSLGAKTVLSVSYVGNQNRHQNDWREINLPDYAALPDLVTTADNKHNGLSYQQLVPYLGYDGIRLAENEANSHYNSLQVDVHGNVLKDLQLQAGYTYSRAEDPVAGNGNGFDLNNVSNPYAGWAYDMGPSFFDRTQVAFVNFVYDLPIFRGSQSQLLKSTLGGWQLSGIVSMATGAPLNITQGGTNVCSQVRNCTNRPDLSGSVKYPKTVDQWFTGDFSAPAAGTWGNLGHNSIRGPGRQNWNMALFKAFTFNAERGTRLEFRAEAFNIWNHTQFRGDIQGGGISTQFGSGNFGAVTGTYNPRSLQFGLKLYF